MTFILHINLVDPHLQHVIMTGTYGLTESFSAVFGKALRQALASYC